MSDGKVDNIILLLNMFTNRKRVTCKSIMDVLDISKRTVYRYIKTLRLLGLPIVWSDRYQYYILSSPPKFRLTDGYRVDEIVLILYGLLNMYEQTGESYQKNIDLLIKKIISSQKFYAEELAQVIRKSIPDNGNNGDLAKALNWVLVTSANILGKTVSVEVVGNSDESSVRRIDNSTIEFNDRWQIAGNHSGQKIAISIDDIISIKILS